MKRDLEIMVPSDLREAEDILRKYGAWAQDRWRRQRCGSAEGLYKHPPIRSVDCEVPLEPFIPDWSAMQVQRCLQVVPMQFRRVLFAYYVPQREHPNAVRRKMGMTNRDWHQGRIFGLKKILDDLLRKDLQIFRRCGIIPITNREIDSCDPVAMRQPEA